MITVVPAWVADAACAGMGPALFYPERDETRTPVVAVCAACPVRADCLDAALERDEFGIWAGTTHRERMGMRRRRRIVMR